MPSASGTIRQIAAETPERLAMRLNDVETTYAELDAAIDRIAARLHAEATPGSVIALQAHSSLTVVKVVVAAYRAGLILVPLDPTAPAARAGEMLLDSGAVLLLTETPTEASCPSYTVDEFAEGAPESGCVDIGFDPGTVQILSYTSGSTGAPKAVMQGELVTPAIEEVMGLSTNFDGPWVVLSAGSLGASIVLLTLGFAFGHTVIPVEVRSVGLATLADLIDDSQAAVLVMVPTVLRFWLPTLEADRHFASLKSVCAFGEAMSGEDHNAIAARIAPDAMIVNAYGQTESGFGAHLNRPASLCAESGPLPVGSPALGVTLEIVDENRSPVPAGEAGEIVVVSASTALGYWHRPELTKAVFEEVGDGRRRVFTGDLGRLLPTGELMHLGRVDHVYKVSGNRVDLGDIEHALHGLPVVADAAVKANVDEQLITTLHAYVVAAPGRAAHPIALRSELSKRLPSWMLPVSLTVVGELPRLANGKVNRKALPDADALETSSDTVTATELERDLQRLWSEVLHRETVPLDTDFFALGGDSMKAAAIMVEVERRHGVVLPATTLLETPTVAALAAAVDAGATAGEDVLIPVRVSGSELPLFVVHGGVGQCFFARDIARHLPAEFPVYGLRAPFVGGTDRLLESSLEQLAARYVAAVRNVQPDGPYRLFGYSAGGTFAYEMAGQLEDAGQLVSLVAFGDSPSPARITRGLQARQQARPRARAVARLRELNSAKGAAKAKVASDLVVTVARHRGAFLGHVRARFAASSETRALPTTPDGQQVSAALGALIGTYQPSRRVKAPLLVIRAGADKRGDFGWSEVSDTVSVVTVDSDHFAMVREPAVAQLAALLADSLAASRRTPAVLAS